MFFRDSLYLIKTLKEFQYVDEDGKDQGANVRQKAKDITNLLQDEGRLRDERRTRAHMRERMIRGGQTDEPDIEDENSNRRNRNGPPRGRHSTRDRDEEELQRAIEESKKSQQQHDSEEQDLKKAIKLSQEEEARRNKAVEDSNAASLFDDQSQMFVCTFTLIGR
jgi:epsin